MTDKNLFVSKLEIVFLTYRLVFVSVYEFASDFAFTITVKVINKTD